MAARALRPEAVARPSFAGRFDAGGEGAGEIDLFDLPSHAPAREALDVALATSGYHAFVLGEDASGRMDATMAHLARHAEGRPPADDWLYLHDFRHPHRPRALSLPAGRGRLFRDRLRELLPVLAHVLRGDLASDARGEQVRAAHDETGAVLESARGQLRRQAEGHGLDVWRGPQGLSLVVNDSDGKPLSQDELMALPPARRQALEAALAGLAPAMAAMRASARRAERDLARRIRDIERRLADETVSDLLSELREEFGAHRELARWLRELQADVLDNLHLFAQAGGPPAADGLEALECRYGANLLVDNGDARHGAVVLEADPTVAGLFGAVAAHPHGGSCHGAIAAGALHRANGGILVLRADDLWQRPALWRLLKGALRDRAIRIAAADPPAAQPAPIPLEAKLVLVGAPAHRRLMLAADPGLRAQVQVKAEIAPHMPADDGAVALFARLVRHRARALGLACRSDGVDLLIGQACRWAGHRDRLSARFELAADLLAEAGVLAGGGVGADEIERALAQRRRREGGGEEEALRLLLEGAVAIDSGGRHVGQANGLLYWEAEDGAFGLPLRLAAHCRGGGVAVEATAPPVAPAAGDRAVASAPRRPLAAVADWLGSLFARRVPLSFSRSPPGLPPWDAAAAGSLQLASACAVLSSLAGVPLRQDVAVAGALDRAGRVLAVDGVGRRVEGFFRLCEARGLSGSQGVIVPAANERHLVLRPEVVGAMRAGRFQLWAVATAAEALELLAGLPAGDAESASPPESVLARARAGLEAAARP